MPKGINDGEILREFALSADPILTTTEIKNQFDISQQAAYYRLRNLEADGYLQSKKIGAKARVYWLTGDGRDYIASDSE